MSEYLDNSFPFPVPVDPVHSLDPGIDPIQQETTIPVDLRAAITAGTESIRDAWRSNQLTAGKNQIWPWIVAGIAIGLFINRR